MIIKHTAATRQHTFVFVNIDCFVYSVIIIFNSTSLFHLDYSQCRADHAFNNGSIKSNTIKHQVSSSKFKHTKFLHPCLAILKQRHEKQHWQGRPSNA